MSLINDALKRAKQSDQGNPPSGGPPYREPAPNRGFPKWPLLAVLLLVVAGIGLIWLLNSQSDADPRLASDPDHSPPRSTLELASADLEPAPPFPPMPTGGELDNPPPDSMPEPEPASTPDVPPIPEPAPVESPASKPANGAAPEPPAAIPAEKEKAVTTGGDADFPDLKLQGIYYRLRDPSILVNGRTLYQGESVEGARLVEIKRHTAAFEYSGQTHVLSLGQN